MGQEAESDYLARHFGDWLLEEKQKVSGGGVLSVRPLSDSQDCAALWSPCMSHQLASSGKGGARGLAVCGRENVTLQEASSDTISTLCYMSPGNLELYRWFYAKISGIQAGRSLPKMAADFLFISKQGSFRTFFFFNVSCLDRFGVDFGCSMGPVQKIK